MHNELDVPNREGSLIFTIVSTSLSIFLVLRNYTRISDNYSIYTGMVLMEK